MDELEFLKKMQELCFLKRLAIKEGQLLNEPDKIRKKISVTHLASGDVAEIWMSYMLGLFSATANDGLRIYVTTALDKEGVDFCLKRFRFNYYVQMKFCKHNTKPYPDYIKVVEVAGGSNFQGKTEFPHTLGKYAVFQLLFESGAYDEDELYDIFDGNKAFTNTCNKVWDYIR